MNRLIKEIIVVEGKDDVAAVKRAVDAELIITHGYGFPKDLMARIQNAQERRGVIIFTDPDFAGENIRRKISQKVKGCKHAFLPKELATKDNNIGIENAAPESIRAALESVREETENRNEFTMGEIYALCLVGDDEAQKRRDLLGKYLGIGYGNAKQFLKRLNNYGVSREEFEQALERLENEYGKGQ